MKKIQWIIGCLLVLTGIACTEDKGNYDYTPLNDLTVTGIEKEYTVEQFMQVTIPVVIEGTQGFEADRYEYLWYVWRVNNAADPDTLSREKDLNVEVQIVPGEYTLRYIVKEKESGVLYTTKADFYVVNSYSKGLMALSNTEGEAEVTFINVMNTVSKDVYRAQNGESAGRNPQGIFYTGGSEDVRGLVTIALEDKTILADPSDFAYLMSFSKLFYFAPQPEVMQCLCKSNWGYDEYVIVGGKVYNRTLLFVDNLYQKYDPVIKGDYEAAPFSIYDSNNAFFYDQKGRRFVFDNYGTMVPVEPSSGDFNSADMQAKMIYGTAFEEEVRAVMEDDEGARFMIAANKQVKYNEDYSEKHIRVLPLRKVAMNQPGAAEATCFAVSSKDIDFLYYAYGNKIVCVSSVTGNILSEYDGFAAGEQIDCMEFDRAENPERLYVGVSDGSGKAGSGSIYYLKMASNGSLEKEAYFEKVCGKVVDFEYKP